MYYSFYPSPCQEQQEILLPFVSYDITLCTKWTAETIADRVVLSVAFALCYLLFHAIATIYNTTWSKPFKTGRPIQTKFLPKEEHKEADLLYIYGHLAGGEGGILKFIAFGLVLLTTTWLFLPQSCNIVTTPDPVNVMKLTVMIDLVMYVVHRAAHHSSFKSWSGHGEHHKIISPTAQAATLGSFRESILLAWLCPIIAINLLPGLMFGDAALTNFIFQVLLTSCHSDVGFVYDNFMHSIGMVTPKTHHVHHLRQSKNLGHVFLFWDMLGGTYLSWEDLAEEDNRKG